MTEAPKKIWLRWGRTVELIPGQIAVADKELDHEYIRADLVDGLVEALEICLAGNGYDFDERPALAALAALKEEE